ncbi:insulin-like 3 (Leydig cell) [Chanos chanos]|uniref:Insulin-like 3 n=1 Tax=Chanos chanos TaxID=29144 RepID=A0A6J2VFH4_CHACN|nr:relaxin-3-like [Chanos chanos]
MNSKWLVPLTILLIFENYETHGQNVRVKLCGREFIRMMVASCGSSRLRRHAPQFVEPQINHNNELLGWFNSVPSDHLRGTERSENEPHLDQVVAWMSVTENSASNHHRLKDEMEHSTASEGLSASPRSRRDVGPAGVCCRSGCTMSELIQYC